MAIKAKSQITIVDLNDNSFYDGMFTRSLSFWSESKDSNITPKNIDGVNSSESLYGGNLLKFNKPNTIYSTEIMAVNNKGEYKLNFRAKASKNNDAFASVGFVFYDENKNPIPKGAISYVLTSEGIDILINQNKLYIDNPDDKSNTIYEDYIFLDGEALTTSWSASEKNIKLDNKIKHMQPVIKIGIISNSSAYIDCYLVEDVTNLQQEISNIFLDKNITPIEKKSLLNDWEAIKTEKANLINLANKYSLSTTDYINSYNDLENKITPVFSDMSTIYDDSSKTVSNALISYYNQRNKLQYQIGLKQKENTDNKLSNNPEDVFNALTDNGRIQGIYMEDGKLYINGEYINAKNLKVVNKNNDTTLWIDEDGNVSLNVNSFTLSSGATTNVPTKNEVKDHIDNIQIGVRNYITNSAFKKGMEGYQIANTSKPGTIEFVEFQGRHCIKFTDIGCWDVSKYLRTPSFMFPENEYMSFSMDVYITKGNKFFIDPNNILDNADFTIEIPEKNKWIRISGTTIKKSPTTGDVSIAIYADRSSETISGYLTLLKAETGTKSSGWTEAPEDTEEAINNKVNIGGSIEDINQSPNGQISYPKLNIRGAISFDDLASEIGQNFIAKTDSQGNRIQTVINGGRLETGSVSADKMTMYNLNVYKRELVNGVWQKRELTFGVSEDGKIRSSGTFTSLNYDENKKKGWLITDDGNAIFNNASIRGRIELPNAGMTDYGGGKNYNILKNTDYRKLYTKTDVGWDNSKNGTLLAEDWGGYNNSVNRPNEGYHAHPDNTTFPFPTYLFRNKNSEIGLAQRWLGSSQGIDPANFKANTKYTFSIDIYFTKVGAIIDGGLYYYLKGQTSQTFHSGQYSFKATENDVGKWKRFTWTFTTNANMDLTKWPSWYIYGYSGGVESDTYVTRAKLEEGDVATPYASTADIARKEVRIYAGTDYYNRYDAPFRVLHDGTTIISSKAANTETAITSNSYRIYKKNNNEDLLRIDSNGLYLKGNITVTNTISANSIKTGRLVSTNNKSEINLDTGYLRLGNTSDNSYFIYDPSNGGINIKANNLSIRGNSVATTLDIQGKVSFSDLQTPGSTTIHGGNIITNSINAGAIKGGTLTAMDAINFVGGAIISRIEGPFGGTGMRISTPSLSISGNSAWSITDSGDAKFRLVKTDRLEATQVVAVFG